MNVQELIEALEGFDPEQEIRIAYQPNYPLRATLVNVTTVERDEEDDDDNIIESQIVWLAADDYVSHNESPYAPRGAWD